MRQEWAQYWSIVKPHASHIRAFYPFDEPQASVITNGAFGMICKALKGASPMTPILTVLDPAAVEAIELGTWPELPPEVDWIGFDNYGCWNESWSVDADGFGHGCWHNRTMPHNLGVLDRLVESRGGRLVVVPDGMAERKCGNANCTDVPTPPTPDQQRAWVTRDQHFFTYCATNPRCVAMLVFTYNSVSSPAPQGGSEMIVGVNQMSEVLLPVLKKMGTAIKMGGVAELLLEPQQAITNIKTDDATVSPQAKVTPPPQGVKCNDPAVANAACFGFDPMDSTAAVRAALATNKSKIVIPHMSGPYAYAKTVLLRHFMLKTIILPRQARDEHRENSKKIPCFQVDCWTDGRPSCDAPAAPEGHDDRAGARGGDSGKAGRLPHEEPTAALD